MNIYGKLKLLHVINKTNENYLWISQFSLIYMNIYVLDIILIMEIFFISSWAAVKLQNSLIINSILTNTFYL